MPRNKFTRKKLLPKKTKQYDVIAKKFISPWGDNLSIGVTEEQRLADSTIIDGTNIINTHANSHPRCSLYLSSMKNMTTEAICNVLRIVSRGRFLSKGRLTNDNATSKD